jgi:hypothetical protein
MPIEMSIRAASTSTMVAAPAILPIKTTETIAHPEYYKFDSNLGIKYAG